MRPRRSASANARASTARPSYRFLRLPAARQIRGWFRAVGAAAQHQAYRLLCRAPVGVRLALGFLFAGLVAALASGFVGLLPAQMPGQSDLFQEQASAANAELTTALMLLQAENSRVHAAIEDAAAGRSHSILLGDQGATQRLAAQYGANLTTFVRENLLAQHPAQANWLSTVGQAAAVAQQQGLVISVIYTGQRYYAVQTRVLQDLLAGQVTAAEALAHARADPMETDVLSALSSLIQFERRLALSVQNAAQAQVRHDQQMVTLLAASAALLAILIVGWLVTMSLLGPLHRLRRGTQAGVSGEAEARIAAVGQDEIADISRHVNDLLLTIDRLLAEVSRQHDGLVSAAERLAAEVSGEDGGAVRAQLAEVGDPLRVLEMICTDVTARFHAKGPNDAKASGPESGD